MGTWISAGALPASTDLTTVHGLVVLGGELYAGTHTSDSMLKGHVSQYNADDDWISIGYFTYGVYCLGVHDGKLYAGNISSMASGGHVWQYDSGTSWTDCGRPGGAENGCSVQALCSFGGYLYAALHGNNTDGHAHVMRWEGGTTWSDAGTPDTGGYPASVSSLIVFSGAMYAGTDPNGHTGKVKRFDGGTTWTDTGLVAAGGVLSLGVTTGLLWAGTDDWERHAWQYAGVSWTDCGEVEDDTYASVWSFAEYDSAMHAGASGYAADKQVARYEGGTTWSGLPRVIDGWADIMRLCVHDDVLFAGAYHSQVMFRYVEDPNWSYEIAGTNPGNAVNWLTQPSTGSSGFDLTGGAEDIASMSGMGAEGFEDYTWGYATWTLAGEYAEFGGALDADGFEYGWANWLARFEFDEDDLADEHDETFESGWNNSATTTFAGTDEHTETFEAGWNTSRVYNMTSSTAATFTGSVSHEDCETWTTVMV